MKQTSPTPQKMTRKPDLDRYKKLKQRKQPPNPLPD